MIFKKRNPKVCEPYLHFYQSSRGLHVLAKSTVLARIIIFFIFFFYTSRESWPELEQCSCKFEFFYFRDNYIIILVFYIYTDISPYDLVNYNDFPLPLVFCGWCWYCD